MNTVVLAGGSGFLGGSLARRLAARGYHVVVLSRSGCAIPQVESVQWDARNPGDWCEKLEAARAVINLVGKSVNCRYTEENRREILRSRLDSVRALGAAIAACRHPPDVLVQAASLAIYGNAGSRVCTEQAPVASGFSPEVCIRWEQAAQSLRLPATRLVILRIGFALGKGGGALQPLSALARRFLGGTTGSGDQYISWLHRDDLNEMFTWAIERDYISGVFNATGPAPVTNREFMRALRSALGRPWSPPVPAWAVRIGAFLMRTDAGLALTGRRCLPEHFLEYNFQFRFPELRAALADVLSASTA